MSEESKYCPLCKREMIPGISVDKHHLIPRTFGGKETIELHKICHSKIHATFTERELLKTYNSIKVISENEDIKSFIKWISKKDPEFYDTNKDTSSRKRKRK